jgi:hypothetical protein
MKDHLNIPAFTRHLQGIGYLCFLQYDKKGDISPFTRQVHERDTSAFAA